MPHTRLRAAGDALVVGLLVPLGVALAVGLTVAELVPPVWRAGGHPYAHGYGKNVEWLAVSCGLWAGAATVLLRRWRRLYLACGALAVVGFAAGLATASWPALAPLLPIRLPLVYLLVIVALACWAPLRLPEGAAGPAPRWWASAAVLTGLVAATFLARVVPYQIDPLHHGGTLDAALHLYRGAHPFRDFLLAHGLHDAGLTALAIALTGKVGTSPLVLQSAAVGALGSLSFYLLGRRLVGPGAGTVAATAMALLALALLGATRPMGRMGMLLFVAVALACSARTGAAATLAMGVALGCGHLFRLETGLFALVAAGGLLGTRHAFGPGPWPARAARLAADGAWLGLGAALPLIAAYAIFGWPDATWFHYVLRVLPAYHTDSDGFPMPWPVGRWRIPNTAVAAAVLLLALAWLATAVRALHGLWRGPRTPAALRRVEAVVFVALFAYGGLRAALGRSDANHILRWSALPLFAAGWLLLAAPIAALSRRPRAAWAASAVAVLGLGLLSAPQMPMLRAHLAPNPPAGECGERMLTAREAAGPVNAALIADQCALERTLRAHGIERLLIDHAAPWYYLRLGIAPPTRFYMLGKAFTPALQRELIDDMRAAGVQAILQVRGYGALEHFDVPNIFRIPVAEAYLRERRRGARRVATPLGTLVLLDTAPADAGTPPAGAPVTHGTEVLRVMIDSARLDPSTGFLTAQGWAADIATGEAPVQVVAAPEGAAVEDLARLGIERPDVAAGTPNPGLRPGWTVTTRIPPGDWPQRPVLVRARFADGRALAVAVDPARVRPLPGFRHPDWATLAADLDAAEALGRADRAAGAGAETGG